MFSEAKIFQSKNSHKLFEKMLITFKHVKLLPLEKIFRDRRPELFLVKGVLKIYSKVTGEHPSRSVNAYSKCIFPEYLFLGTTLDGCF